MARRKNSDTDQSAAAAPPFVEAEPSAAAPPFGDSDLTSPLRAKALEWWRTHPHVTVSFAPPSAHTTPGAPGYGDREEGHAWRAYGIAPDGHMYIGDDAKSPIDAVIDAMLRDEGLGPSRFDNTPEAKAARVRADVSAEITDTSISHYRPRCCVTFRAANGERTTVVKHGNSLLEAVHAALDDMPPEYHRRTTSASDYVQHPFVKSGLLTTREMLVLDRAVRINHTAITQGPHTTHETTILWNITDGNEETAKRFRATGATALESLKRAAEHVPLVEDRRYA